MDLSFIIIIFVSFLVHELLQARPRDDKNFNQPKVFNNILLYMNHNHCLHLHHWILYGSIIVLLVIIPKLNNQIRMLIIAFCLGGIIQGMTYALPYKRDYFLSPFQFKQNCASQLKERFNFD